MVKLTFNYSPDLVVRKLLEQIFDTHGLECSFALDGSVTVNTPEFDMATTQLESNLSFYGITVNSQENVDLVERIKTILLNSVLSDSFRTKKVSALLSDELCYSYAHLSHVFSKATFTSIENFLILIKIEKVKDLLMHEKGSLTDIAHLLDYSSVSHLSSQFKKHTGLTVSQFLKLNKKRK